MFLTLHQVFGHERHIVAQIVETELIVGAESNVTLISCAAFLAVGARLVDAGHREAVELIERTHPFRVALGQIVVHRYDMHTFARESVEEDRQRGHQRLTLARSHLRNVIAHLLAVDHHAVKHLAADELNIVMHHIPFGKIAAGHPFIFVDGLVALNGDEVLALSRQRAVGVSGRNL